MKNDKPNSLNILYEDNHLIVVYKPFGLLTQGDKTKEPNLYDLVKKYIKEKYHKPGNVFLGLVHRLDRPVAGIVVFAKTSKAASRISEQFRKHSIEKKYLALVEGNIRVGDKRILTNFILKNHQKNKVQVTNNDVPNSKQAILECEAIHQDLKYLKLFRLKKINTNYSLLIINLKTGRSHQIRAQLSHIGHPILGDIKYNSSQPMDKRICLIAHKLTIQHPTTKNNLTFSIKK